jgi:hypothetical protein
VIDAKHLLNKLQNIKAGLANAIDDGLSEAATKGAAIAKDVGAKHFKHASASGLLSKIKPMRASAFQHSILADAPYASYVEFGRGWVFPVKAKALRFVIDGQVIFAKSAKPSKPVSFMGAAATELQNGLLDRIMAQHIAALIQRA